MSNEPTCSCGWCGRLIIQHSGPGRPAIYCDRAHRQAANIARRAGRSPLYAIGARDRWACGICGEPVDPNETGRTRPSLDHWMPLAIGGTDDDENIQISHLACNLAKKDRHPDRSPVERVYVITASLFD